MNKNETKKQAAQISVINPDIPSDNGIDIKNIRTAARRMSCGLRRCAPINASAAINIAVPWTRVSRTIVPNIFSEVPPALLPQLGLIRCNPPVSPKEKQGLKKWGISYPSESIDKRTSGSAPAKAKARDRRCNTTYVLRRVTAQRRLPPGFARSSLPLCRSGTY